LRRAEGGRRKKKRNAIRIAIGLDVSSKTKKLQKFVESDAPEIVMSAREKNEEAPPAQHTQTSAE
jgi:hypothetical protein